MTRRHLASAALLAVASVPLLAQGTPAPFPAAPPTVTSDLRASGFAEWREARRGAVGRRVPRLLASREISLVVATNAEHYLQPLDSLVDETMRLCRDVLALTDEDILSAALRRPWAAFDSVLQMPALTLTLQPEPSSAVPDCRFEARHRMALSATATLLDGQMPTGSPLVSAAVRVDGRVVAPLLTGQVPVRTHSVTQDMGSRQAQLRMYLPLDAFVPRADGSWPDVLIEYHRADGSVSGIALPEGALRAALDDALPWLVASARPAADARWSVPLRDPKDATLRRAMASRAAGPVGGAMPTLLDSLRAGRVRPRDDQLTADIVLGEWLAAAGDSASASRFAASVRDRVPCFRMSPQSASPLRPFLTTLPEGPQCARANWPRVALLSVALPGLGQTLQREDRGRQAVGIASFAATVATFLSASSLMAQARDDFEAYRNAPGPPLAVEAYEIAEARRKDAMSRTQLAFAIWGAVAVENLLVEWRRDRRLVRYGDYDAPRAQVGLVPLPGGRLGVGITVAP